MKIEGEWKVINLTLHNVAKLNAQLEQLLLKKILRMTI